VLTKLSEALDEAWVLAADARKRHSLAE